MTYYVQTHVTQFDGSAYAGSNCTPAALANGIAAASAGKQHPTAAQVRATVKRSEEQFPVSAGWSTQDAALAALRLGVPFANHHNYGWARLRAERDQGRGVILAGMSHVFTDATCSGKFDGAHRIYVHPATLGTRWWIDDPICRVGRWELESVLLKYAAAFDPQIDFGTLLTAVPHVAVSRSTVYVAHGAVVRIYTMSVAPTATKAGTITGWREYPWTGHASSAPCGPVRRAVYHRTSGASVVRVTAGVFKDQWIRVGAAGVTVKEPT